MILIKISFLSRMKCTNASVYFLPRKTPSVIIRLEFRTENDCHTDIINGRIGIERK